MTSPVEAPAPQPIKDVLGTPEPAEQKGPTNQLDKDAFLKLLVAQLKYQDPLNPASGTEFIAQTAQLTQVQKLEDLAGTEQRLLTNQLNLSATALVGKTITYAGKDGTDQTGVVTGATLNTDKPIVTVGGTDVPLESVKDVHTTPAG
jgi:flagellar basal-body rod modification protein FlgD